MSLDLSWTKCHYLLEEKKSSPWTLFPDFPEIENHCVHYCDLRSIIVHSQLFFRIIQLRDKLLEYI